VSVSTGSKEGNKFTLHKVMSFYLRRSRVSVSKGSKDDRWGHVETHEKGISLGTRKHEKKPRIRRRPRSHEVSYLVAPFAGAKSRPASWI
jgi:hypothetical protein